MSYDENKIPEENDESIVSSGNESNTDEPQNAEPITSGENGEPTESDATKESGEEKYAFEWNYTNIQDAPPAPKRRRKKAGLIFGIIASSVLVTAIIALIIAAVIGTANGLFNLSASGKPTVDYNTQINVSTNDNISKPEQDASSADLEKFKHSTVVVLCDSGTGTGIILDDNGMIITNHHVIENSTSISVYLYDGRNYTATLIGSDAYNDVAVIKINAPDLIPATFTNSDNTYTGQRVYAVGTPAGPEFAWSVTAGIVSCPSRELKFYNEKNELERSLFLIQTDALVNPGNSGGPLINANCEVMGIVTMRLSDDYVGMGFAIPTNVALPIVEDIITNYREVPKLPTAATPQLGISGIVVEEGERFMMSSMGFKDIVTKDYYDRNPDRCNLATHAGIYVLSTTEGFDAASKLQAGDIIIAAEKTEVTSMEDLKSVIASKRVGEAMNITIVRNNDQLKLNIVLGKAAQ